MHATLRAEGRGCSRGRVERLMRRHGIRALAGRRFRLPTTDSRHYLPIAPNLPAQRFEATAPNRVWLADISYIPTGEGWLYLAAVLDLATRKIVGWAMRDHLRTELTLAALLRSRIAICRRGLCRSTHRDRRDRVDAPHWELLRQGADGEILPYAEGRTGPSMPLGNARRSPAGSIRIYRRLL